MTNKSITNTVLSSLRNFLCMIFIVGLSSVSLLLLTNLYSVNDIILMLNNHTWSFRLIRWAIIILFIVFYRYWISWKGRNTSASQEQITYWKAELYQLAIWLILFELLICENVIYKLIHAL